MGGYSRPYGYITLIGYLSGDVDCSQLIGGGAAGLEKYDVSIFNSSYGSFSALRSLICRD